MQQPRRSQQVATSNRPGVMDGLAKIPARTILREKAMAAAFGVSTRTIRRMVERHELPPGVPLAGKMAWMTGKLLAFLEMKLEQAEKSALK